MEVAKITSKGQITIPIDIRRRMNLNDGDKVLFLEQDGRYYIENSALVSISRAQDAFSGEAARAGITNQQDVIDLVKEIRRELGEKRP
ncbi:MAG: AbrB/MazE/SpoVT family DNA-binding domain-containing protein [Actinomycetes bacterium]|jgi:AbrB family looped-hinge helix DNA binding protein|nr:AbrB/MazE/SpoVT family DNA-binding domain-containing protein [Actinomycetes bacterium]